MDRNDIKIILIGDSNVGKTCLAKRYVYGSFDDGGNTIGLGFEVKKTNINSENIDVRIFDTAGQEKYHSLVSHLFNSIDGTMIVFDVCSDESFNNVQKWLDKLDEKSQNIPVILVGNKTDRLDDRVVLAEQAENFAKENNLIYIETSAKSGCNVNDAFNQIIYQTYEMIKQKAVESNINISEPVQSDQCLC